MSLLTRRAHTRWASATTLQDLADLTALWLEGRLNYHPNYGRRPDPETALLVPVLARLNRAGFLTSNSQPGSEHPGHRGALVRQRAAVDGFADTGRALRLKHAAEKVDLYVHLTTVGDGWDGGEVCATTWHGRPETWFGAQRDLESLECEYQGLPNAVAVVREATQFTVVDPVWGRNDVLWPLLDTVSRFAGRR